MSAAEDLRPIVSSVLWAMKAYDAKSHAECAADAEAVIAACGVGAAVEAFRRFGWHHMSCAIQVGKASQCDCGFMDAWDVVVLRSEATR